MSEPFSKDFDIVFKVAPENPFARDIEFAFGVAFNPPSGFIKWNGERIPVIPRVKFDDQIFPLG